MGVAGQFDLSVGAESYDFYFAEIVFEELVALVFHCFFINIVIWIYFMIFLFEFVKTVRVFKEEDFIFDFNLFQS